MMDRQKSMTSPYHLFQICWFVLMMTACSSAGSAPISEITTPTGEAATLSWDASRGSDAAGYKIYQATAPGAYGAPIATVPMTVTNYTVTGLEAGTTYFFTVTAHNADGAESSFSNEVSKTIP
jgi:fibronectin type 3 domain-containing protein